MILGGAGGVGATLARSFAAQKPTLVLVGRSPLDQRRAALLDELGALGADAHYRQVDITDAQAVDRLVAALVADYGAIDGVVQAAGVVEVGSLQGQERRAVRRRAGAQGARHLAAGARAGALWPGARVLCRLLLDRGGAAGAGRRHRRLRGGQRLPRRLRRRRAPRRPANDRAQLVGLGRRGHGRALAAAGAAARARPGAAAHRGGGARLRAGAPA